jgi:hypothetical protein
MDKKKSADMERVLDRERIKEDFAYWAETAIRIRGKGMGRDVPFILNAPQRRLLGVMEEQRRSGRPIRIILLKARQWGGSTLVQLYMLWIQLLHRENWDSVICGMVEQQSRNVRAMIERALATYPPVYGEWTLRPFEGSSKNRHIAERGCTIFVTSAGQPDTIRSADICMAHLTEVGLWGETGGRKPGDIVQSIVGSLPEVADSLLVIESTAKGVGNWFHRTWMDAVGGRNNLTPVFVEWFAAPMYAAPLSLPESAFRSSLTPYEEELLRLGASLEGINWYRQKASSPGMEAFRMRAEYPSTALEAFQSTGRRVFRSEDVDRCRSTCRPPDFIGDLAGEAQSGVESLSGLRFDADGEREGRQTTSAQRLCVWQMPCPEGENFIDRYVVAMDIGGCSSRSDPSDIVVLDRAGMVSGETGGDVPEVVAEWHGHTDIDRLAWKALQIATAYHNALLVIESNTAESRRTEGNHFESVLDEIVSFYPNLYCRTDPAAVRAGRPRRWGFHMNASTKPLVINHQVKMLRDGGYIERNAAAADEFDCFEVREDGLSTGAVIGAHDDRVITRAIACYIAYTWDLPSRCCSSPAAKSLPSGGAPSSGGVPLVVRPADDIWRRHLTAILHLARPRG